MRKIRKPEKHGITLAVAITYYRKTNFCTLLATGSSQTFLFEDGGKYDRRAMFAEKYQSTYLGPVFGFFGTSWPTGDHSGIDTALYGYAASRLENELEVDMAGSHGNTTPIHPRACSLTVTLMGVCAICVSGMLFQSLIIPQTWATTDRESDGGVRKKP